MKPIYNSRADIEAAPTETRGTLLKMLWSATIDAQGNRSDSPTGYTWQELDTLMEGTPPPPVAPAPAEPDPVPVSITRRQALLLMIQQGKFTTIEKTIAKAAPEIRVEYDNQIWRRDNPTLIAMAQSLLEMDSAMIDAFFVAAAKL